MKKLLLSTAVAAVMAFSAGTAQAVTVNAPADIDILRPIRMCQISGMDFGKIAIDTGTSGSTAYSDGTTPVYAQQLDPGGVSDGVFHVSGANGATYTFDVPDDVKLTRFGGSETLLAVLTGDTTGTFGATYDVLTVTGEISGILDTQAVGAYHGTYATTATYP